MVASAVRMILEQPDEASAREQLGRVVEGLAPRFPTVAALLASLPRTAQGTPLGFVEDFALATDRCKTLDQLSPGTEDYYYYHCLHHQQTGQYPKAASTT